MNILILILTLFALIIPVTAVFNLKLGVALCIAFEILVPSVFNFSAIGAAIPFRVVYVILFLCFFLQQRGKMVGGINFMIIKPFFILLITLLVLTIFQSGVAWNTQLYYWIRDFLTVCILPVILWNGALYNPSFVKYTKVSVIIATIIACTYGLFLTRLGGINPYDFVVMHYFGSDFSEDYANAESGRLFGRIQSTFEHPMSWALFLVFICIIIFTFINKEKKRTWPYYLLLAFVLLNLFVSGVRTGIVALIIGLGYYAFVERKVKVFAYALVGVFVLYGVMMFSPKFNDYILSIFDFSGTKSTVQGSSMSMRISQFMGALYEIRDNAWVGKGYGWTTNYLATKGDHPVMYTFESLIFVVLCNSGIIGCVLWVSFFLAIRKINRFFLKKQDVHILNVFLITYIVFAVLTGEYGYLKIFAVYYTFLFSYLYLLSNDNEVKTRFRRKIKSQGNRILPAPVPSDQGE